MMGEGSLGQGIIFVSLRYDGIPSFRKKVVKNPPVKKYDGNDLNHLRYHVVWTGNDDVKSKLFQEYKIELFQAKRRAAINAAQEKGHLIIRLCKKKCQPITA